MINNCVPLYINDNVSRFYDEYLPYDQFEARCAGFFPVCQEELPRAKLGAGGGSEQRRESESSSSGAPSCLLVRS